VREDLARYPASFGQRVFVPVLAFVCLSRAVTPAAGQALTAGGDGSPSARPAVADLRRATLLPPVTARQLLPDPPPSVRPEGPGEGTPANPDASVPPAAAGQQSFLDLCQPGAAGAAPDQAGGSTRYPIFRITGVFQVDTIYVDQTKNNVAAVGPAQDAVDFRRARLAATGNVTEDITYIVEFDFAAVQPTFVDVFANWTNFPVVGNVRVGRWRQPFGMSEMTSIRELPFLEHPLTFPLAPFRQTGIGIFDTAGADRLTWALSGYRFQSDPDGNVIGNRGYGLATRVTGLLYQADDHHLFHVGGDYSFDAPATNTLRYASHPEIFGGGNGFIPEEATTNPNFVDTGTMSIYHVNLFNAEAAWLSGPFALQSEARWSRVDQRTGGERTLPAAYVLCRYVLTGEDLTYNKKAAVFTRVQPRRPVQFRGPRGWGAWELAGRWSYIDLNGTNGHGIGGQLNDLTFGINWYLNSFTKWQFNYIHAYLNQPATGRSQADFYGLRFQLDF